MDLFDLTIHNNRNRYLVYLSLALVGVCSLVAAALYKHAFFVPWRNIGNPINEALPGEKVDRILGSTARSIRVGTNHRRAFEADLKWIEWGASPEKYPVDWNEVEYEKLEYINASFGCPFTFWEPPLLVLGKVIAEEQVKACRLYVGIEQAHFVILGNGTVWVWENQQNLGDD